MAKGRAIGRFEAVLGLVGILALGLTYSLITGWNPWPGMQGWLNQVQSIASPAATWTAITGDPASSATAADGAVIVVAGPRVFSFDQGTGELLWSAKAGYAAVAGQPSGQVVVIAGRESGHGYDALDPRTGAVLWSVPSVLGVWTFQDLVVGLACPQAFSCTLSARTAVSGEQVWQSSLPGTARGLSGANHALASVRELAGGYAASQAAQLRPAPPLLGFPMDNQVAVVSTVDGKVLHTYRDSPGTRYIVAGHRVIATSATYRAGACLFTVQARDPATDTGVWKMPGFNPRTGDGLGCDQHRDPSGGAGMIAAVGPDNRDVLLDPDTGHVLFTAPADESIMASDGRVVLLRVDRKTVRAADLGTGQGLWTREVSTRAAVGLCGPAAVVADGGADQLVALDARSGAVVLSERSQASVVGFGESGLLARLGGQIAWFTYGAGTPAT